MDRPYTETQPGEDGNDRLVWMFPIRPVPENNVKKPPAFVFVDWDDYRKNGKAREAAYNTEHVKPAKKSPGKSAQKVRHKKFGEGVVVETKGDFIVVNFGTVGKKQLNLQVCLEKGLMEFV